jgi:hypothetical protein
MPEGKRFEKELLEAIRRASGDDHARWGRPPSHPFYLLAAMLQKESW